MVPRSPDGGEKSSAAAPKAENPRDSGAARAAAARVRAPTASRRRRAARLARPRAPEARAACRQPRRLPGCGARARRASRPALRSGGEPRVPARGLPEARALPGPATQGHARRWPRPPEPAARRRASLWNLAGEAARGSRAGDPVVRARLQRGRGRARSLLRQRIRRERNRARRGCAGRGHAAGDSTGGPRWAVQDESPVHHSRWLFLPRSYTSPGLLQLPKAVSRI